MRVGDAMAEEGMGRIQSGKKGDDNKMHSVFTSLLAYLSVLALRLIQNPEKPAANHDRLANIGYLRLQGCKPLLYSALP